MTEINCIGEACPIPVIKTKKALESMTGTELVIIVDNEIAAQNLEKLAKEKGCIYSVAKNSDCSFQVVLKKNGLGEHKNHIGIGINEPAECKIEINGQAKAPSIVAISSDKMGDGDIELGQALIKGFIYALCEHERAPQTVIFYNKGAYLTGADSGCLEDLEKLKAKGVEILTCGACIDFYGLTLGVGEVTNMYEILERLLVADKIIRP